MDVFASYLSDCLHLSLVSGIQVFLRISVGGAITCMVSVDGAITCMVGVNQLNGCKHVQRLTINGINMYKE